MTYSFINNLECLENSCVSFGTDYTYLVLFIIVINNRNLAQINFRGIEDLETYKCASGN